MSEYDVVKMLRKGKEDNFIFSREGEIYKETQVSFAYHSSYLEGIRLNEYLVECIYEYGNVNVYRLEDEIITLDDIQVIKNHFDCFDYMLEHVEDELSEDFIKECYVILNRKTECDQHEKCKMNQEKNTMKETMFNVEVNQIEEKMKKMLENYKSLEKKNIENVFSLHCELVHISPFDDKNGLIARLILFKECLKHAITPFIIEDVQKKAYFHILRYGETDYYNCKKLCFQSHTLIRN